MPMLSMRGSHPLAVRPGDRSAVREAEGSARPEPGILCWNCRRLTPFERDRCQSCGAAFAGSTGGMYATSRLQASSPVFPSPAPDPSRTLADLLADIQRVHDVSSRRPRPALPGTGESVVLFQCPSCGRFVSDKASECSCGVKFSLETPTFACPECDSLVPELEDACPVCGVRFEDARSLVSYSCPKCGVLVAADAVRCACGVWFED